MVEAYCVKCKSKKEMKNPQDRIMKNGKSSTMGSCPDCGTTMNRINGNKKAE